MRFPNQSPPIVRVFMREVVGKRWASEPGKDADVSQTATPKKRGRRKPMKTACLVELTTFAASRARKPFGRAA
jgi:hypothetical protein